jgi:hypothetical protein
MAASGLKANFENQLKEIDEKIAQIQGELEKAKEYKLKLQGGLETLELLEQQEEEKTPDDLGALPETTEE